jgi:signal transduction histidine kinase
MRERLVVAFVAVSLATLVVFGVVRAYALASLIEDGESVRVERTAALLSTVLAERQSHREPVTASYLRSRLGTDERVRYVDPAGRVVSAESPAYRDDAGTGITRTVPVGGGGTLTVARSRHGVEDAVSDALLPLVLLAIVMVALAALLGWIVARWLAGPFRQLARAAEDLGRGRFDLDVPTFSIPEVDVVGRALQTSAAQLHDLVTHEREFVLSASHELNTPVTALRLELEELSLEPDLPAPAAAGVGRALADLDRLHATVGTLLEAARRHRADAVHEVDLHALASRLSSDRVTVRGSAVPWRVMPGPVEQLLDVLVGHLLDSGPVRVEVTAHPDHARVVVHGTGPSVVPEKAREAAAAVGGHLSVDTSAGTSYVLRLPRV